MYSQRSFMAVAKFLGGMVFLIDGLSILTYNCSAKLDQAFERLALYAAVGSDPRPHTEEHRSRAAESAVSACRPSNSHFKSASRR
jgi:hypothetical protein